MWTFMDLIPARISSPTISLEEPVSEGDVTISEQPGATETIMRLPEMKMNRCLSYLLSTCLVLIFCLSASAQEGLRLSGQAKLGYVFIDDDGRMSTTQEIFNVHSGLTLQNLNLRGFFTKNSSFELNLSNINQDNRSLFFSLMKPGLFSLTSRFNQSRFVFDEEGDVKSERTFSSISGYFQPAKFLKLRTDLSHQSKEGDRRTYYDSLGIGGGEYDQLFWSAGFGGQLKFGKRFLDFEYRLRALDDKRNNLRDREGSRIRTSLNSPLPQNIFLSLHYLHDENKLKESGLELKSDLFKSSLIYHPARQINLSTKFMFQRTENQSTEITSDVLKGSGEISYRFYEGYRLNLGYEHEKRKDDAEGDAAEAKITVNSYLVGGYAQFIPELSLRARYVFQDRRDEDAVSLTGSYEDEKILVELKSKPVKRLNLRLRYEDKRRDNPDISSSVCDRGFVSSVSMAVKEWLGCHLNYSLLDVDVNIGGDLDIRKEGVSFGFDYALMKHCLLQGKYDVYDYDDYLYVSDYYTSNVYTISLVRKFGIN
jgi:hypothetical protein